MSEIRAASVDLVRELAAKTPQPTQASLFESMGHLSHLRRDCAVRDHHRCVVTRVFDAGEGDERLEKYGDSFTKTTMESHCSRKVKRWTI